MPYRRNMQLYRLYHQLHKSKNIVLVNSWSRLSSAIDAHEEYSNKHDDRLCWIETSVPTVVPPKLRETSNAHS